MKLSIITINYNNCDGLQRTIDSIIGQTWHDFEWIVIDGGSTDGSKELIEKYQNYFSYWCSELDKGVYNAMNKGIAKAKGEYVNCMNSGDVFVDSETLSKVFAEDLYADMVYGDWIRNESFGKEYKYAPKVMSLLYIYTDNICHQSMFVKTKLLKERGFDENMKIFADWQRWRELAWEGYSFQYVPYPVCLYEVGGLSDTTSPQNKLEREMMYGMIPTEIKSFVDEYARVKAELWKYKSNSFLKDTYNLICDRPLYCHFVKLNLGFLKVLKTIVDYIKC